ncbi:MAG: substrate-binding domain-containing protein [Treponema sp.]|nr:substrate-binding domain-containing protein [Treponema sp.]
MKTVKVKKVSFFSILFVCITLLSIVAFCVSVCQYVKQRNLEFENFLEDRNYHILVTGDYENNMFLRQVFEGAEAISADYNSIVELYVPQSYAQNVSLQELFDYASFANADAVIAFFSQSENIDDLVIPIKKDAIPIPLITIGTYHPQIPQVAYVGINYSEMGKKTAEEAVGLAGKDGLVFLVQGEVGSVSQNSNFMNSFHSALSKAGGRVSRVHVVDVVPHEQELIETYNLKSESKIVFITLNEMSAVQCSQIVSAYTAIHADIICVGNSEITESLFERHVISEIIAVDPQKIGAAAIKEIFEYLYLRHSNNYITAELQVRKAAK